MTGEYTRNLYALFLTLPFSHARRTYVNKMPRASVQMIEGEKFLHSQQLTCYI